MDADSTMLACIACQNFQSSSKAEMERHVAVVHGEGAYSTLRCMVCQRKYYDFDHFSDHTRTTPNCISECFKLIKEPLPPHLANAFTALVDQMMRPLAENQQNVPVLHPEEQQEAIAVKEEIDIIDITDDEPAMPIRENFPSTSTPYLTLRSSTSRSVQGATATPIKHEVLSTPRLLNTDQQSHSHGLMTDPTDESVGDHESIGGLPVDERSDHNEDVTDHGSVSLTHRCQQIFGNRKVQSIDCQLCKKSISAKYSLRCLHSHAEVHLNRPIYSCMHCKFKGNYMAKITHHLKSVHGLPSMAVVNYKSHFNQFKDEFIRMFQNCFGSGRTGTPGSSMGTSVRLERKSSTTPKKLTDKKVENKTLKKNVSTSIRSLASVKQRQRQALCKQLVQTRYKQQGDRIRCNLCPNYSIRATNHNAVISQPSMQHTYFHLKKPVYRCLKCNKLLNNAYVLANHLRFAHSSTTKNNYVDESDQYHDEIMDILNRCFGGNVHESIGGKMVQKRKSPGKKKVMMAKKAVSGLKTVAHLLHLRQLCACDLVHRFGVAGKIKCQRCSVIIDAKTDARNSYSIGTHKVIQHVHEHLDRPLYRCRYCDSGKNSLLQMEPHMKNFHGKTLKEKNGYVDNTHLYHDEILALLNECYGVKGGPSEKAAGLDNEAGMSGLQGNGERSAAPAPVASPKNSQIFRCQHAGCGFSTNRALVYGRHLKFLHSE